MTSKTDASVLTNAPNTSSDDAPSPGKSLFGTLVRAVLLLGLLFFMLKPYLFKGEEPVRPTIFNAGGKTMGTDWNVSVCADAKRLGELNRDDNGEKIAETCEELLQKFVQRELDRVDEAASTFKPDSDISRFNRSRATDWIEVAPETAKIVAFALDVAKKTGGAFDPTVAPLVDVYRFGPNKSPLVALPTDEEIAKIRERVGFDKIEVRQQTDVKSAALRKKNPETTLDLSAVAKGFAVDCVAQMFEASGLTDYLVEVGGEVRCGGQKTTFDFDVGKMVSSPWRIGIETPEIVLAASADAAPTPAIYYKVLFDASGALATSGDYHNWNQVGETRFSHILDPRTGKPTEIVENGVDEPNERLGSVSVVASTCVEADALATAFFVLGEKDGIELADKLGISVLYLFRADESARTIREAKSNAFETNVHAELFVSADAQQEEKSTEK